MTLRLFLMALSSFCMFALHAHSLDAPTLIVQEYRGKVTLDGERQVSSYLAQQMKGASSAKVTRLGHLITKLAHKYNLSPGLVLSIIKVESGFQAWAVSPRGALGLMQVMPETGEWIARRHDMEWAGPAMLLDEQTNVTIGIQYLAYLKEKYDGDLKKMLAAYNVGPGKVDEDVSEGRNLALAYYHKVRQLYRK